MPPFHFRLFTSLIALLVLTACGPKDADISLPTPNSLTFTGQAGEVVDVAQAFTIQSTGNITLDYDIYTIENWLQVSNGTQGTLAPRKSKRIFVRTKCLDEQGEALNGTLDGDLHIKSNAFAGDQAVTVQLICSAPDPGPDPNPNPNPGGYNIEIRGLGSGFTPARQAVFEQAATRWSSIITGDLADIRLQPGEVPANTACGYGEPAVEGTIDDLVIFASIAPIDGRGGTLGQAGPKYWRHQGELTIIGCMQFDSADVADLEDEGTFDEVILHEMGHVLGIGTLWDVGSHNLLSYETNSNPPWYWCYTSTAFDESPNFTGSSAVAEFAALGRSGNVPVEDEHGPGTQCSHWDEEYFGEELMTGFLGAPGSDKPLSRMTIASLQDMGYVVDLNQAEAYSIPACSPNCVNLQGPLEPIQEIILAPEFAVTPEGKVVPLTGE